MLTRSPMNRFFAVAAAAMTLLLAAPPLVKASDAGVNDETAHDFSFPGVDGEPLALGDFRGKPMLVVNTASRCGFTYQYEGLQSLWDRFRERGLVVIGAPSDDFNQELADKDAVKEFCEINFGINFPMTDIVRVRGAAAHPFFAWAARSSAEPDWNFNKYLVDSEGVLVRRYGRRVQPEEIAQDIEALLNGAG